MTAMEIARWIVPIAASLVLVGGLGYVRRRLRLSRAIGDSDLLARMLGHDIRRPPYVRLALATIAAVLLAAAYFLAPPPSLAAGGEKGPVVIAFDISNSMLTRDIEPSRLGQGRAAARVIARESGALIGIVAFAGGAYVLTPPTSDATAITLYLDALHPGMVTQTGSSLSAAIRQALALIVTDDRPGGAMVLISDGDSEEHGDSIEAAIELARRVGVRVHALGAGTASGGPVPNDSAARADVRAPATAGSPLPLSRLDEARLRRIASRTGGVYAPVGQPATVTAALNRSTERGGAAIPIHLWLTGLAGALLLLEFGFERSRGRASRAIRSSRVRRAAQSAAAIAVVATLVGCAPPADPADDFVAGDLASAAEGYRALLAAHPGSPTMHYNLGATLLREREYDAARTHLEEAARGGHGRIRQAAWYNIGNSHLEPVALGATAERAVELSRAIVAYKYALLFDATDDDARWNLELARRWLEDDPAPDPPDPEPEPAGGGAGGGGDAGDDGKADLDRGDSPQAPRPESGAGNAPVLSPAEADELLDAASRRETAIQREKLTRPQPPIVSH